MTGQPLEWDRFAMFTFTSWLMVLISQSLGFMIGAWFSVIVSIYEYISINVHFLELVMGVLSGFYIFIQGLRKF